MRACGLFAAQRAYHRRMDAAAVRRTRGLLKQFAREAWAPCIGARSDTLLQLLQRLRAQMWWQRN